MLSLRGRSLALLFGLALLVTAPTGDISFEDGRRRLTWRAAQGGCLASATLRSADGSSWSDNVLLTPVAVEAAERLGGGGCSACAAPGALTVLFRNATALRLRARGRCGGATVESTFAVDGWSDAVDVVAVFHAGRAFAPTVPTVPTGNALSVRMQVASSPRRRIHLCTTSVYIFCLLILSMK
jgi:hypothetical protein